MNDIKKIVIIGPESTGKTTLCKSLAEHYNTNWCPEYAREYLLKNRSTYTYEELLTIAKGQLLQEETNLPRVQLNKEVKYFIDTNMMVMKVWSEFVFGKCHEFILEELEKRTYDLYLLCVPDLEWKKDELREYPDLSTRQKLFNIYETHLRAQDVPWFKIFGKDELRLMKSIEIIDEYFK